MAAISLIWWENDKEMIAEKAKWLQPLGIPFTLSSKRNVCFFSWTLLFISCRGVTYALRRNSSHHCISSSQWVFYCIFLHIVGRPDSFFCIITNIFLSCHYYQTSIDNLQVKSVLQLREPIASESVRQRLYLSINPSVPTTFEFWCNFLVFSLRWYYKLPTGLRIPQSSQHFYLPSPSQYLFEAIKACHHSHLSDAQIYLCVTQSL